VHDLKKDALHKNNARNTFLSTFEIAPLFCEYQWCVIDASTTRLTRTLGTPHSIA
jgi:hypothetical protein